MGIAINILILVALILVHVFLGAFVSLGVDIYYVNPLHKAITTLFWPYGIVLMVIGWISDTIAEIIYYYKE